MTDDFVTVASIVFRSAGVSVGDDDLALVHLVHDALLGPLAVLDAIDPTAFPFEPIDPSGAPDPR